METAESLTVSHQTMTHEAAQDALEAAWRASRRVRRLKFRERKASRSAFVSASWLWMADQDPAALGAIIEPYLRKLESITAAGPSNPAARSKSNKATESNPHDPAIPPTGNRRLRKKLDG